ncbi:LysR family transcriptional regulator [Azospirillum picis]|uniref:DNA-binding transcriptional LysR family regulator n=1 Tax=Azospirillum picis TaxID=488438 RepID=A0ABU0MMR6_9PROT|nr:LysR family transcriptional regulator [Azospirillum picis]MBP2300727.1 DNA-binding transcriptional LysR family regulator [Azospirillum picis]MDQ0534696.1 DNA-binding transcriptional LysR family regulator [Azospirillum picis]
MLNPQWVQSFTMLAEVGSFTRAAGRLGLTQAAVSQHVRHLEDRLGPLLIRHPRGVELTPAGAALLDYGRELERADRRLKTRIAGCDTDHGEVGLITPGSVGLLLYPLLLDFQAAHRGLIIRHRFAPDGEVLEAVLGNRFELGLTTARPDDHRLATGPFTEEPLELVVPAGEEVHDWSDLERIGYIDHPDGQAMAARLLGRRFPRNPGVRSLPYHGFSNQIGLILEPVARGLGFTVIPRYARQAFARAEAIRVVECGAPVVDTLWLIHRAEWPLPARARQVAEHLRGRLADRREAAG